MLRKLSSSRRLLSRWASWFFLANTILMLLIGLTYVSVLPNFSLIPLLSLKGEILGVGFVVLGFIGTSAFFAFAVGLVAILLIQCSPRRWFAMTVSVILASLLIFLMLMDTIIYHMYHYHLVGLVWNIVISGAFTQVIVLSPIEWLIIGVMAIGVICLECLLAYGLYRYLQRGRVIGHGRLISLVLVACLFVSYSIYLGAAYETSLPKQYSIQTRSNDHLIIMEAQVLPYYNNVLAALLPDVKIRDLMKMDDGFFVQNSQQTQPLNYPLAPIKSTVQKHPYNIVIIAIDTWRYDMMNATVSPNIAAFAKKSIIFTDNYSGGDSTQPGIFSLFYSLPSPYWTAMLTQHQGPVFVQQLMRKHYQFGVFGSAELTFPAFNKTVFLNVPNLQTDTPGDAPAERDVSITKEFNQFVNHRNKKKPFFGFLFYDAVHGYCETETEYPKPFQPEIAECNRVELTNSTNPLPYINRYKNAVLYDDSLVGEVLQNLKSKGLLKNTIVVITADHGEEFNDEHLDYWGHASAFDPYQVRTPLIVYWPGKQPDTIFYRTSHYDVVPTLMSQALGVTTLIRDYGVGHSLFSNKPRPYFVVGSYVNYAVLQPNQTTIVYQGGDYDITYPDGYAKPNAKLNPILIKTVYDELNRYYQ